MLLSMLELFGTIKLSYRQAENRRVRIAVLCLKYIASLTAMAAAFGYYIESAEGYVQLAAAACAVVAILIAVCMRGILLRDMYLLSEGFLRNGTEDDLLRPGIPALLSGELVFLAALSTVIVLMLSPAYICLDFGIKYYSLSADRGGFMLLFFAALLLASGGMIFAIVIRARLGCAEYLRMSGQCPDMLSALDCSWELTRGDCGDILRLSLLSALFAPGIGHLCSMNYSQKLLRSKGMPDSDGLRIEIICNSRGERHLELV